MNVNSRPTCSEEYHPRRWTVDRKERQTHLRKRWPPLLTIWPQIAAQVRVHWNKAGPLALVAGVVPGKRPAAELRAFIGFPVNSVNLLSSPMVDGFANLTGVH